MRALLVIILLLTSCGSSNSMHVTKETVTLKYLKSMCDDPSRCKGYADYYDIEGYRYCTIYMLPYKDYDTYRKSWYLTHDESYMITYGHEMRHCEEGDWHP